MAACVAGTQAFGMDEMIGGFMNELNRDMGMMFNDNNDMFTNSGFNKAMNMNANQN